MELELFYKIVESRIRAKYIKRLKAVKSRQDNIKANPLKEFGAGVDMALTVLTSEFKSFSRRLQKEEKDGSKF